jgi:hypothetical protein
MSYRDLIVWEDETGETFYIQGHVDNRRAIAAVNRYVRETTDHETRKEYLGGLPVGWITVDRRWLRPDPQFQGDDETAMWCSEFDPLAQSITVVRL